jgi:hypothetical protein
VNNTVFYFVAWSALLVLGAISWFHWRRRNRSQAAAFNLVRAATLSYNPTDPAFNQVSHRKAIFGIVLALALFLVDAIAGFPDVANVEISRGFYVFVALTSIWVLCSDWRARK